MPLKELHLVNYCRFRDRTFTFSPRMNVIVGQMGSGKTSLLNALLFALTGLDRNAGVRADNVSQFAAADEDAYVELLFGHGGRDYRVRRGVATNSARLTTAGEPTVQGIKKVTDRIVERLGVTTQQLEDYVFVPQRKMDAWFSQTPTKRAEELAELFRLGEAEKIYDAVGSVVDSIPPSLALDEQATIAAELDEARRQLAVIEAALRARPVPDNLLEQIQQLAVAQSAAEEKQRIVAALSQLEAEAAPARQALPQAEVVWHAAAQAERDIDQAVTSFADIYAQSQQTLVAWQVYDVAQAAAQQMTQQVRALVARTRQRPPLPIKPPDYLPAEFGSDPGFAGLVSQRQALVSDVTRLKRLTVGDDCPTCGQPLAELVQRLREQESALADVDAIYQPLQSRVEACRAYDRARLLVQRARAELRQSLRDARQQRRDLSIAAVPAIPRAEAQETLRNYHELVASQRAANQSRMLTQARYDDTKRRVDSIEERRQAWLARQASLPAGDGSVSTIHLQRTQLESLLHWKQQIDRELATAQARIDFLLRRQATAATQVATATKQQQARETLLRLRAPFHPNEAPKRVSQDYLARLVPGFNEVLSIFSSDFRVSTNESLAFTATFADGVRRQPDARLSEGQRLVLSFGFRITLNATFARELGILSLDEPTSGLDEQALSCLSAALVKLRDLSESRGLQVLFVTHEQSIRHLFDHTIDLSQGG